MKHKPMSFRARKACCFVLGCVAFAMMSGMAFGQGPVKITLDDAIQLALQHNHSLLAARTTIQQSEAQEITANLKPNPVFFTDWEYLPLFTPRLLEFHLPRRLNGSRHGSQLPV